MKIQYRTEAQIRERISNALYAKRRAQNPARELKPEDVQPELMTPRYQQWIEQRVQEARERGQLVTPRQQEDLRVGRTLKVGDRVRYVGESVMETSPASGRQIVRPHGQQGTIVHVATGMLDRPIYHFMPDVTAQMKKLAEVEDVEVLRLVTDRWNDLERVAE